MPSHPFLCHPELTGEGSPWGSRPEGNEGCLSTLGMTKKGAQQDRMEGHDRMEDVAPSASEGSLGACLPRAKPGVILGFFEPAPSSLKFPYL